MKQYLGGLYDQLSALPGGVQEALSFLVISADAGDESSLAFLGTLFSDEGESADSLEEVCKLAKVDPFTIASTVVTRFEQDRVLRARIKAAAAMHDIVEMSVSVARTGPGFNDRKLLMQAGGFAVEAPKAPTVVVDNRKVELAMPSLEETLRMLDTAKAKALPAAAVDGHYVSGEIIHVQPEDHQ